MSTAAIHPSLSSVDPTPAAARAGHPMLGAAAGLVLALLGAAGTLLAGPAAADDAVTLAAAQHHLQVFGGETTTPGLLERCRDELAARYLPTIPADTRLRLGEQVRQEQREGRLAAGNAAFVQRRLALYEAELQRGSATLASATIE
ncbi:MAG: hypothetical protein RIQ60_1794 [Pseudomonadota bacterium]|jgi:hypothetical protein